MRPVGRSGVRKIRSRSLDTATLLARIRARDDVLWAEPNYVVSALAEPSDPSLPLLWGLRNTGQAVNGGAAGRAGADIHAESAWDVSLGSVAHVVAVVDTGIDYAHPDLAPNIWSAPAAFTVTIGGVALTCPAGSHGFNAIEFSCNPMDDHLHGTHVAGTIGAAGNNGVGVVGVNWTTRLMGIKFLDASGAGTVADAIDGIEFAMQARQAFAASGGADVRVLSNSWGGRDFSQALQDEIEAAAAADMLFVAAAGNDGFSNDLWPAYPASYPVANVVAVAATTNTDARAWFSNYGPQSVHLGAPGTDILSTIPGGTYGFSSGTSMAAPHVSGAAALVLSRCDLDTAALKEALVTTVEPVAGLAPYTITGGRLDVNSAIRSCAGPPAAPADLVAQAGDRSVALTWSRVGRGHRLPHRAGRRRRRTVRSARDAGDGGIHGPRRDQRQDVLLRGVVDQPRRRERAVERSVGDAEGSVRPRRLRDDGSVHWRGGHAAHRLVHDQEPGRRPIGGDDDAGVLLPQFAARRR